MQGDMEELFETVFGAKGRINQAQYWRSLVIFSVASCSPLLSCSPRLSSSRLS
jgi:uncharacterized membrane protein YhaH (DUF805 family)